MADVWSKLEEHDELERKTIELATKLKEDCPDPVAKLLLGLPPAATRRSTTRCSSELDEFKQPHVEACLAM
jgi:hypothetical protein